MKKNAQHLRGFSLMELMVSITLTVIITAAAAASTVTIYRQFLQSADAARTDAEAKVLGEFIISHFRQTGGDVVRPWMSTRVLNSPVGDVNGDTFIGAEYDEAFPSCALTAYSDTSATFAISAGACCFDANVVGHQMMVVQESGTSWTLKHAASINTSSCTISWTEGLTDELDNEPADLADLGTGSGVVVDVVEIRHNGTTRELQLYQDADLNNVYDNNAGVFPVIAPGIYDVQYALGFDFDPVDGRVTDDQSDTDEWLYNHGGDIEDANAPVPAGADRSDLRLVSIAFITGWSKDNSPNTLRALDGDNITETNVRLRMHKGTAYFRNDFTFQ